MTTKPAYKLTAASTRPDLSVAMPELGPGATLRLGLADLAALQTTFGDSWFADAPARCNAVDVTFIAAVVERAGRIKGERVPLDMEAYPEIPVAVFAQRALDALYLAVFGRNFVDELRHRLQASASDLEPVDGNPVREAAE